MITEAIFCTAVGIYFEARAETLYGQLMVANVIENRVQSKRYPNNNCDVLLQHKQFSFFNGASKSNPVHIKNHKAFNKSLAAAQYYYKNKPQLTNACHYATIETSNSWTLEFELTATTMGHSFYEGGCGKKRLKYINNIAIN